MKTFKERYDEALPVEMLEKLQPTDAIRLVVHTSCVVLEELRAESEPEQARWPEQANFLIYNHGLVIQEFRNQLEMLSECYENLRDVCRETNEANEMANKKHNEGFVTPVMNVLLQGFPKLSGVTLEEFPASLASEIVDLKARLDAAGSKLGSYRAEELGLINVLLKHFPELKAWNEDGQFQRARVENNNTQGLGLQLPKVMLRDLVDAVLTELKGRLTGLPKNHR